MIKTPLSTMMGDGSNMNAQSTDELEFADFAAFPASGEPSKLYIALDVNRIYRWTGSTYVEISSAALVDAALKLHIARKINGVDFDGSEDITIPTADTVSISLGGTGATTAEAARSNLGLGTAATRDVGTSADNVMEVGAFGLGSGSRYGGANPAANAPVSELNNTQMYGFSDVAQIGYGQGLGWVAGNRVHFVVGAFSNNGLYHVVVADKTAATRIVGYHVIRTAQNTTVDSNGFIKSASPIVQLFADKIELNDEAQQQNIVFEKLGVGDYLVKGSSGFAQDGWYIETPKDANGNVLFSVIYENLENGDISVKTYKKKFDLETASIVADLTQPVDITAGRWIDLRLQELPQPEIEVTDDPEQ